MSARDSASGSSDWKGGGGGMTANGGIGGGMGGGLGGGGAGRTGGYGGGLGGSRESFGGYKDGGLAAAVVPLLRRRPVAAVVPVRPKTPVGMAPAWAPPYATMSPTIVPVSDDMIPGFGETYTPPQNVSLPSPKRAPDVAPLYNNGVYGGFGHTAIAGGLGSSAKIQDRVGGGASINGPKRF